VDESVFHLQDSSFQSSLGREGAVPVWVGIRSLETKSGVPNPNGTLRDTRRFDSLVLPYFGWFRRLCKVPSFSILGSEAVRARILAHPQTSFAAFSPAASAIFGCSLASRSAQCYHPLTLIY